MRYQGERRQPKGLWVGLLLALFVVEGANASYFRHLRQDEGVPEHCRETQVSHFDSADMEYFTLGGMGAEARGFHREYPVDRDDARFLWDMFRHNRHGDGQYLREIDRRPELRRDYDIMLANYESMDFDFGSEGEVLELLAIVALRAEMGADYFVYGSVQYHDRLAGELDLIIARVSDCEVEAVGEAKLGKSLSKARRQLARFETFIRRHMNAVASLLPEDLLLANP